MILVIAFYTDKKYEKLARRLAASAKRVGVTCWTQRLKNLGSWQKNTLQKPGFIRRMMNKFRNVNEFLLVDADAVLKAKPISFSEEFAVYRFRPSKLHHSDAWHNLGILLNGTIYMRRGQFTDAVLLLWGKENREHPERLDQKNLATVLARADSKRLRCLPPEYCWVERIMRPLKKDATPVIVHEAKAMGGTLKASDKPVKAFGAPAPAPDQKVEKQAADSRYELAWAGHLYDLSGYAKANREILFRVGCTYKIQATSAPEDRGNVTVDEWTRRRIDAFTSAQVSASAPFLRFYTPKPEAPGRHRILFTMMETSLKVHPDMVRSINQNYHELWTPTRWNAETFRASSVRIPISVIPLGVDRHVYRPGLEGVIRKAQLLTTRRAGASEIPKGVLFIYVCQPTFRKAIPFLIKAFSTAFPAGGDAALVIATTAHAERFFSEDPFQMVEVPSSIKARIYHLTGSHSESEMAALFSACQVYVATSIGEGWNLPMTEAAACGLPVVAPYHSSHGDLLGETNAFVFKHEGYEKRPEGDEVCKWYRGQVFAKYGRESLGQLVDHLRFLAEHHHHGRTRVMAGLLSEEVRSVYTWENAAGAVLAKLEKISK